MNAVQSNAARGTLPSSLTSGAYTLPQTLFLQAQQHGNKQIAIRQKAYGIWKTFDWKEYLDYSRSVALGLHALGMKREDNVAMVLDNEPEWLFSELGVQAMGGVTVNLFTSAVAREILYGINRISATYVIVQDQEQVDKLIENQEQIQRLRKIIYLDQTGMRNYKDNPLLISFAELLELGQNTFSDQPGLFEEALWKGKADDVALMIMTSGTTGLPKMVMLSHANLADMSQKWLSSAPVSSGDNWISISPPAWIVDQMWSVGICLFGGLTVNFPETLETVTYDFRQVGPNIIITSSRFWEDLASRIRVKMSESGMVKRLFYHLTQQVGQSVIRRQEEGRSVPHHLKAVNRFFKWTVSRPLMDRIGCLGLKSAYTGGHPISPEVIRFFRVNGLNLKQCYGMTEAGGIFQVQPDGEVKPETVGRPLPGTEVRLSEDEEVMVRSNSVFVGYYQNPEATAEAIVDGWFLTGDAGFFDDDGHLVILGRKQDIMRTREGDPFSPDFIETRLKFSPYIKEAVIWGEGKPYLSAFINIDFENVGVWAEDHKIPYTTYLDLSQQPAVEKLIQQEVQEVNQALPEAMQLARILLLYKLLDADDEELTRTGKVRRKFVAERYQELIDALYSDKTELAVKGQVNYRDGTVGTIESTIHILSL